MPAEDGSPGVIDNGGSVTALISLAEEIREGNVNCGTSSVTILLTCGEEVGTQGARCYAEERWRDVGENEKNSVFLINLELSGQEGDMYYIQKTGVLLNWYPADTGLVDHINRVRQSMGEKPLVPEPRLTDDSIHFGRAGIPIITIGHTGNPEEGFLYRFHTVNDSMERFYLPNLLDMKQTLIKTIELYTQ